MREQLISFETAKLAKEKGFIPNKKEVYYNPLSGNTKYEDITPTQSLLQRWLREEHNIIIEISFDCKVEGDEYFLSEIHYIKNKYWFSEEIAYCLKYEEALEAGLEKALELIR